MKNNTDEMLIDYISSSFMHADDVADSNMLTTEDIDQDLRDAGVAYLSQHEIQSLLSESFNFKYKIIPGTTERLWLIKRCPTQQ
jgi:hypothetical protein